MAMLLMVAEIGFAVWAAWGKSWFWYPINIVLLFFAASVFATAVRHTIFKFISLIKYGYLGKALAIMSPVVVYLIIAYCIAYFVLSTHAPTAIFLSLAAAAAIIDGLMFEGVGVARGYGGLVKMLNDPPPSSDKNSFNE